MASEEWKRDNADKMREYRRTWYERNKVSERKKAAARSKQRRKETYAWLREFKRSLCCNRCPETDWRCLEFHHLDPSEKDFVIATAAKSWGKNRILKEMKKCEVLCANCHRKHHIPK
jgi:hypothetical protein